MRTPTIPIILAALLAVMAHPASSQDAAKQILEYQGPDRSERLIAAAKKEGMVNLYTSINAEDVKRLTAAFEAKYGVKVNAWRSRSENVVQRTLAEANAQRYVVDAIETNGPELEALARENVLTAFYSPFAKELIQNAIPGHRLYFPTRFNVFVQAYNTNLIRKEDLPKTYEDLLKPQWKGKLGIEQSDADWMAELIHYWGEKRALDFFRGIGAQNLQQRKGHIVLANLVAAGDVPLALTIYSFEIDHLQRKQAPIAMLMLDPVIAKPNGVAIAKRAPHPNAALLFADFMLTDAQKLFSDHGAVPANTKAESPIERTGLVILDPAMVIDGWDKWSKLWDQYITKTGK